MALAVAVLSALFALCLPLQGILLVRQRANAIITSKVRSVSNAFLKIERETQDTFTFFPDKLIYLDLAAIESCSEKITP